MFVWPLGLLIAKDSHLADAVRGVDGHHGQVQLAPGQGLRMRRSAECRPKYGSWQEPIFTHHGKQLTCFNSTFSRFAHTLGALMYMRTSLKSQEIELSTDMRSPLQAQSSGARSQICPTSGWSCMEECGSQRMHTWRLVAGNFKRRLPICTGARFNLTRAPASTLRNEATLTFTSPNSFMLWGWGCLGA